MRLFIFLASLLVAIIAVPEEEAWIEFKKDYSKEYKSLREEKFRFEIFKSNLQMIDEHNKRFDKGEESYNMEINQFSDLTDEEFQQYLGYTQTENEFTEIFEQLPNFTAPTSVDWRSKGAVLSVKFQGKCESCWAFSAIGAVEGQNAIKHGVKTELSEQELVDCSGSYGNKGCNRGLMDYAFKYMIDNGISTASSYPYVASDKSCLKSSKPRASIKVTSFKDIAKTESALQQAVASVGPISVGIVADLIKSYKSGIFDNSSCGSAINHAVLVVGYGSEGGKDYWIVKNSWGSWWGESGYIRMSRNKNNQCGIALKASYPIIA